MISGAQDTKTFYKQKLGNTRVRIKLYEQHLLERYTNLTKIENKLSELGEAIEKSEETKQRQTSIKIEENDENFKSLMEQVEETNFLESQDWRINQFITDDMY
jgi:hypothetical protein